ncbi:MAG: type IV pilin protein [Methylomonas sp.]|nr:type IV pilin protein [Methylomonas sp.]
MKREPLGFTLIELMIAVGIVGILAAIAIPGYQGSIAKSRRAEAKGDLLGLANAMERHFTENNSYCDAGGDGGSSTCGGETNDTGSPSIYPAQSPAEGTAAYELEISVVTASTYTLTATPTGNQANDKCGTLTLTHTGEKSAEGGTECW